ncbi:MAG: 3-hydroxyisobutyrate dehydrogenase [Pseudomonadota bacterium]
MAKIAFIGVGNMGGGMALNLVRAGHDVHAYDLNAEAKARIVSQGGHDAASVEDAVKGADAAISMLPAGKHVRSVYGDSGGVFDAAEKDCILIDCSTIDVTSARDVSALAADRGLQMVDAPVSGGTAAADGGTLTFMVGGTADGFAKAQPFLQHMGKAIIHAGDAGAGQAAKICNNMLLGITMIGTCEAFVMAEKLGLDPQIFFDISSKASGQSWSMTSYCPVPGPVPTSPANHDYEAGFSTAMMLKDLKLAMGAASSADASTPMGALAEALYKAYDLQGNSIKDFSGIINLVRGDL